MKNKKNLAIYGVTGAAAGFGISKLMKTSKKTSIIMTIALAGVGAWLGNRS